LTVHGISSQSCAPPPPFPRRPRPRAPPPALRL